MTKVVFQMMPLLLFGVVGACALASVFGPSNIEYLPRNSLGINPKHMMAGSVKLYVGYRVELIPIDELKSGDFVEKSRNGVDYLEATPQWYERRGEVLDCAIADDVGNGDSVPQVESKKNLYFKYDSKMAEGIIAVRINGNRLDEARKFCRDNIETIARDKNVALYTGEAPSEAKYYILDEEIVDDNILEMKFKVE